MDHNELVLLLIKETSYQKRAMILNKLVEINNSKLKNSAGLDNELKEIDGLYKKLIKKKKGVNE